MIWIYLGFALIALSAIAIAAALHIQIIYTYIPYAARIFQEKPLFIVPFGKPREDAEDVTLDSTDSVTLKGCYLKTTAPRKGVILFGVEFGSNRWSCQPYCDYLLNDGYDIFSFEMRGQGQSKAQEGYRALQWVTNFELDDFRAAISYLKNRPDRHERGIGFFGISKGGSAGLIVAAYDPFVNCCIVDSIFATVTTMIPYMQKWIHIYSKRRWLSRILPVAYFRHVANYTLARICKDNQCIFPHLEEVIGKLSPRPLLMIHGSADNYIKPEMAESLFRRACAPKELWIVEGAKHNQSMQVAGDAYRQRVLCFFANHLATTAPEAQAAAVEQRPLAPVAAG